ncbi:MAG: FkbM family methyltransferase [Parcubacteria group bacterium]|nr:FkbM family methyltransferase [Parcubacteria group bacterium]
MATIPIRTKILRAVWKLIPNQLRWYSFKKELTALSEKRPQFFFVQIGANDGVLADPLRYFILKYHWQGVFLEPIPSIFELLQKNYAGAKGLYFENVAIANEVKEEKIYYIENSDRLINWCGAIGSFSKEHVLKHGWAIPNIEQFVKEVMVKCITFPQLLEKYHIAALDLVCIDTEGFDFEIIKQIPFDHLKPRAILYEHRNLSKEDQARCKKMLIDQGYVLKHTFSDTLASLA